MQQVIPGCNSERKKLLKSVYLCQSCHKNEIATLFLLQHCRQRDIAQMTLTAVTVSETLLGQILENL